MLEVASFGSDGLAGKMAFALPLWVILSRLPCKTAQQVFLLSS